jgi:hypothetical protein
MQNATGSEQTLSCHLPTPAPSKKTSEGIGNCMQLSRKCVADRVPSNFGAIALDAGAISDGRRSVGNIFEPGGSVVR